MTAAEKLLNVYEALAALPDGVRGEIIAGELHTAPRPSVRHQAVSRGATTDIVGPFDFERGGPGGWLIVAEPELHLGRETSALDVLVPDLAGWRRERLPSLPNAPAVELAPDWVCEILSPTGATRDRGPKAARYLHHGVAWMWFIDPDSRYVECWEARDGRWTQAGVWPGDTREARIPPFDAVAIDLTPWWVD
jgi:Uma2 family endonuclease